MFLYVSNGLEDIIASSNEVLTAICEVKTEKLEEAVKVEKVDLKKEKPSDDLLEALAPVVEQDIDPITYDGDGIAYEIGVSYGASTEPIKGYYEKIMGVNGSADASSASFATLYNQYEHEVLEQAQNIAAALRDAANTNRVAVDSQLDMNLNHVKNRFKTASIGVWYLMYEGKLQFN